MIVKVLYSKLKFRGYTHGRADVFLRTIKIHRTSSFAGEVKQEALYVRYCGM
jgi:hypothetical protein